MLSCLAYTRTFWPRNASRYFTNELSAREKMKQLDNYSSVPHTVWEHPDLLREWIREHREENRSILLGLYLSYMANSSPKKIARLSLGTHPDACQHPKTRMADRCELVINKCYGGFGLSELALQEYNTKSSTPLTPSMYDTDLKRHDPILLQIVKDLGDRAYGQYAKLKIVTIPAQYTLFYTIDEYDGMESVTIHYDAYKVAATKAVLRDVGLTRQERIARALAVLESEPEH